ncbi:MAG: hypothetical protein AB4426_17430 [Xenococcaceae cyanobacterium]
MSNSKPKSNQKSSESKPPSFETEREAAKKYLQGAAQSFIQWMPMGGTGFVLGSFLLEQDWLKALITFPVMIVTVVWAAYTKSVLARLEEIYQERGRKDVDSFMAWQNRLD